MRLDGLEVADGDQGAWATWLARLRDREWRPAGFSMLAAGCLVGIVGIAAVLFAQQADGMQRYVYREVAGAGLSLALLLFLAGGALSLPVSRMSQATGATGLLLAGAGIATFVVVYPYLWNTSRDWSYVAIILYGSGLALLVASLTAGLITSYVEAKAARAAAHEEEISEEEVMRDILDATNKSRLTWGGVYSDDRTLDVDFDFGNARILSGSLNRLGLTTTTAAETLETDVGSLLAFRGVKDTAAESYDDDNVLALTRLRQEQEAMRSRPWHAKLFALFKSGGH